LQWFLKSDSHFSQYDPEKTAKFLREADAKRKQKGKRKVLTLLRYRSQDFLLRTCRVRFIIFLYFCCKHLSRLSLQIKGIIDDPPAKVPRTNSSSPPFLYRASAFPKILEQGQNLSGTLFK
jgi:hypothetical protein